MRSAEVEAKQVECLKSNEFGAGSGSASSPTPKRSNSALGGGVGWGAADKIKFAPTSHGGVVPLPTAEVVGDLDENDGGFCVGLVQ